MPAIGGFCFQQTGIPRFGNGGADPSLNVDPTRSGVEPDIAFTGNANGVQDGVPWVVWYEKNNTDPAISGLTHNNKMVFAAKGVADGVASNGGFHWVAVGSQGSATLDATGTNHLGGCAASDTAEAGCSLNQNAKADAENPRVAAGTMNPANATVPWVTWDEDVNGVKQVLVSRLVGGTHFELVNNAAPISAGPNDSTRPDITFSGNTPYVSWREDTGGGVEKAFTGHFINPANPTFVLDASDVPLTPSNQADVREPISSSCIATPFNNDGQACQGAAVGTPFLLYTNGTNPRGLFADAYQPDTPVSGAASAIGDSSATVSGSVNPLGASVNASFQFGTTTAYGQSSAAQKSGPDESVDQFSAQLTGLPAGTTVHYRAVAASDFGTLVGADRTLTTRVAAGHTTVGHASVSGITAHVLVSCTGTTGSTCALALNLTATEKLNRRRLIVGSARVTLTAGRSQTVRVTLNRAGRRAAGSAPSTGNDAAGLPGDTRWAGGDRVDSDRDIQDTASQAAQPLKRAGAKACSSLGRAGSARAPANRRGPNLPIPGRRQSDPALAVKEEQEPDAGGEHAADPDDPEGPFPGDQVRDQGTRSSVQRTR